MIKVHRDLHFLPEFKKAVITIGTFDGVHLGHRKIIHLLKEEAAAIGGETVIITFHPHPRKIVSHGKSEIKNINSLQEKIELLNGIGIDHLVVVAFNDQFANQTAAEYIEHFLVKKFSPQVIIIGYDHKFGKNRSGDYHLLEEMGEKFNYKVKEIPERVLNQVTISSTKIREALLKSDVETANEYLGYHYFFAGKVVEGNKIGRTIGFPTANLLIEDEEKLVPGNGVYAVVVNWIKENTHLTGMMNIGYRPTINGNTRTIEVNIFNFEKDIYNETLKINVIAYLRGEVKFNNIDELKEQLSKDKVSAIEKIKNLEISGKC